MGWTADKIPSQQGRKALITGANSGIGLEAARELARRGAHIIMACRSRDKAEAAMADIRQDVQDASLEFLPLDLSRQKSIHEAAAAFKQAHSSLDLLINNAGIMWVERALTEDGFESQLGTNHFGHFTLTGLLLDRLLPVAGSRVVTVSSIAHRGARIRFKDITWEQDYGRHRVYAQSKIANLIFAIELQRRLTAAGAKTQSIACHPGISSTNLFAPGLISQSPLRLGALIKPFILLVSHSPERGALPTLYAATAPEAEPGGYYGPTRIREAVGAPGPAYATRYARSPEIGARLWALSEQLTGVSYPLASEVVVAPSGQKT